MTDEGSFYLPLDDEVVEDTTEREALFSEGFLKSLEVCVVNERVDTGCRTQPKVRDGLPAAHCKYE
jgi:hypothetical protein